MAGDELQLLVDLQDAALVLDHAVLVGALDVFHIRAAEDEGQAAVDRLGLEAGVADREVGLGVPLVVRLEGTNVELGKKVIAESGLNVVAADDLDDAAQKIVRATRKEAA